MSLFRNRRSGERYTGFEGPVRYDKQINRNYARAADAVRALSGCRLRIPCRKKTEKNSHAEGRLWYNVTERKTGQPATRSRGDDFNETGEKITELYVTDNLTGEKSENLAGEGLEDGTSVEINGTNKPGYVITLSFTTENGYEAAFGTLHFETVPISLLPAKKDADAVTGATPISFSAPAAK